MNRLGADDALDRTLREALRADAERAPQLPVDWPGPTTFGVSGDGTDDLAARGRRSITMSLESTLTEPAWRQRWPIIAVAAAAVGAIVVGGLVIATRDDEATGEAAAGAPTTMAQPATVAQAPVKVSACVHPGPLVHGGTSEGSSVSVPEGTMTIVRSRGDTWQLKVSDVSDPRLDGTWYNSADADQYSLPGGASGPHLATETHRIENDDGAWQGSFVVVGTPDHPSTCMEYDLQYVLVGEGAYEGLTAVMIGSDGACPNTEGYIVEGNVPAPPVPQTGQ